MSDRIDELMRSLHGNPRVVDPSPIEQKLQAIRNPTQQPRDGKNGIDGVDGAAGADGKDGRNGIDGTAGADGADGKDGKDGKDGIDGMNGLDGAVGEQGDAGMIWRGTYRSDIEYWIGDVVGVSGSAYVCVAATNQAPPIGFGWELLVSRGAQGIRGIKGEDGVVGPAAAGTLTGATLASNVLASSLTSVGTLTAVNTSGVITGTNTTASTTSTTGAVIIAGGAGIAKDSYINTVRVGLGAAGSNNTTLGASTGTQLTAGSAGCTMVGYQSGFWNSSGNGNTSVGQNCLLNTLTGSWNSALGINAIYTNQSGSHNVSVGLEGLYSVTGSFNTGIGSNSGYHLAGASTNNICIGYIAGKFQADGSTALTTSSNSCYIGTGSRGLDNSDSNSIVIGSSAIGLGANTTVIGNSSTTSTKLFGTVSLTGDTVNVATQKTPASATATGTKGDIVHDTLYIYVCTAANTWKRVLISTW